MAAGCFREAGELLDLARELTGDPQLILDIDALAADVATGSLGEPDDAVLSEDREVEAFDPEDEDAHFMLLCSTPAG